MFMKELIGKKVLITCSAWFYAPDGKLYKGVWGTLKNIVEAKEAFGFIPSRSHANWFIEVGNVVITGCQVNYLVQCPVAPDMKIVDHQLYGNGSNTAEVVQRQNEIYITPEL